MNAAILRVGQLRNSSMNYQRVTKTMRDARELHEAVLYAVNTGDLAALIERINSDIQVKPYNKTFALRINRPCGDKAVNWRNTLGTLALAYTAEFITALDDQGCEWVVKDRYFPTPYLYDKRP